jgi:nicotinate-nucleotide adenylyltransferase
MATTKIGLLGGAFDPVTKGHVKMAQYVIGQGLVDEVWLVPSYSHHYDKKMASPEMRLKMCEWAVAESCRKIPISVCPLEICWKNTGGTIQFINSLLGTYSFLEDNAYTNHHYEFHYIIGADNAYSIDKWIESEKLRKTIPFIVVNRKGEKEPLPDAWFLQPPHAYLDDPEGFVPETSSTDARKSIKNWDTSNHKYVSRLLHPEVLEFIFKNKLYQKEN